MAGIEIKVSGENQYSRLAAGFCERLHKKLRLAVMNAINRTLAHERTYVSQIIRKQYYIKKSAYDAAVKIKRARGDRLFGSVNFEGTDNLPLSRFPHSVGKKYISVRVLKEGGRKKRIASGGSKNILSTKKGIPAVFKARSQIMARVAGSERPVILYGPSLMAFFKKEENISALQAEADQWFEKRLAHELSRVGL